MARTTHPDLVPHTGSVETALEILDAMTAQGNSHAHLRKLEVEKIAGLLRGQGQSCRNVSAETQVDESAAEPEGAMEENAPSYYGTAFFGEGGLDYSLSGMDLMDLVDALDPADFLSFDGI
jgi:hypothetical protein